MKVTITSSVSEKLRDKRIEINEEFCRAYGVAEFKEATVEVETQDAYHIVPRNRGYSDGQWVAKEHIIILPAQKDSLDRWA